MSSFKFLLFVVCSLAGGVELVDGCSFGSSQFDAAAQYVADAQSASSNLETFSTAYLQAACHTIRDSIAGLDDIIGECSEDMYETLRESLVQVNNSICSAVMFCVAGLSTCWNPHQEVLSGDPDFETEGYCDALIEVLHCAQDDLAPQCFVFTNVSHVVDSFSSITFHCERMECNGVNQCYANFGNEGFPDSGLTQPKCLGYYNYVSCLNGAIPSCDNLDQPIGQPAVSVIASFVQQGCTRMNDAATIYSCDQFTVCFDDNMEGRDAFSPTEMCMVVQETMSCATKRAEECEVHDLDAFIDSNNNFMLNMANQGCGLPRLELGGCDAFDTCRGTLEDPNPNVLNSCSLTAQFMTCVADTVFDECGLEQVNNVNPSFQQLSVLTGRLCEEIEENHLDDCDLFGSCAAQYYPSTDSTKLSTFFWCKALLGAIQCALITSFQCGVANTQVLNDLYNQAIQQGCTDFYSLHVFVEEQNGADHVIAGSVLTVLTSVVVLVLPRLLE